MGHVIGTVRASVGLRLQVDLTRITNDVASSIKDKQNTESAITTLDVSLRTCPSDE